MASIAWGSKLVVRAGDVEVSMRSLRTVDLTGSGWAIPVMADLQSLQDAGLPDPASGPLTVDLTTDSGPIRMDVEIVATAGDLMLRSAKTRPSEALRPASLTDQRRENVRGPVNLEFRGTLMGRPDQTGVRRGPPTRRPLQPGSLAAMGPGPEAMATLIGVTTSISAGGLCADLEESAPITPGVQIYGEVTLPGGDLVPVLMIVLEETRKGFRAEFTDISPIDRERLVRLVFNRERTERANRR
ncbi:PilZ domain-containing protein [Kineosporia sp. NBRC 101731]|uniref:PilZ domain-containing protein n=1 Tax=Kineosporia sp. NBRC 101731 TaxID=3032199 RepID=UPI0024A5CF72|nr:PilZ domain-containing protein [Kineosporia sp. NBRC 101731]GLY31613.1 hypothetical protein Kisp02_49780 [Kineosporia sp. NBRC 101731]